MNNTIMNKILPLILTILIIIVLLNIFIYFVALMMPFIIAFIISTLAYPIKKRILKVRLGNAFSSILALIIIFVIIIALFYGLGMIIKSNGGYIANGIRDIISAVDRGLENLNQTVKEHYPKFSNTEFDTSFKKIISSISENSVTIGKYIFSYAKDLPKAGLYIIITIIASFFTIIEYEKIIALFKKIIHDLPILKSIIDSLKSSVFIGMKSWFKAQLIIILFSSIICSVGLLLSGYGYWLLLGIIIAIADALPIIGSGAFLVPISLYNIITGNFYVAIIIFITYILVIITRQMVEPRIVGKSLGINPLLTLIAIYLGFKFGSLLGVFIAIFLLVIIVSLYKTRGEKNDILY